MIERLVYGDSTQVIYTVLLTSDSRDAKIDPTLASGDVQISKDGGAFANLSTLPTVSPSGSPQVKITFSGAELECKTAMIRFKDQTDPTEWEEQHIIIETKGRPSNSFDNDMPLNGSLLTWKDEIGYSVFGTLFPEISPSFGLASNPRSSINWEVDSGNGSLTEGKKYNILFSGFNRDVPAISLLGARLTEGSGEGGTEYGTRIILGGYRHKAPSHDDSFEDSAFDDFYPSSFTSAYTYDTGNDRINETGGATSDTYHTMIGDLSIETILNYTTASHGPRLYDPADITTFVEIEYDGTTLDARIDVDGVTQHEIQMTDPSGGSGDIYVKIERRGILWSFYYKLSAGADWTLINQGGSYAQWTSPYNEVPESLDFGTNKDVNNAYYEFMNFEADSFSGLGTGGEDTLTVELDTDSFFGVFENLDSSDIVTLTGSKWKALDGYEGEEVRTEGGWTFVTSDLFFRDYNYLIDFDDASSAYFHLYLPFANQQQIDANEISGDWTSSEKEQIRDAIGVDGTKTAATGGDIQDIKTVVDNNNDELTDGTYGLSALKSLIDAVAADIVVVENKIDIVDTNVDTIVSKLPSSGLIFSSDETIDGETASYIFELMMAIANGRYAIDVPASNKVTFYKRDNTTPLTIVSLTNTERTRDS